MATRTAPAAQSAPITNNPVQPHGLDGGDGGIDHTALTYDDQQRLQNEAPTPVHTYEQPLTRSSSNIPPRDGGDETVDDEFDAANSRRQRSAQSSSIPESNQADNIAQSSNDIVLTRAPAKKKS